MAGADKQARRSRSRSRRRERRDQKVEEEKRSEERRDQKPGEGKTKRDTKAKEEKEPRGVEKGKVLPKNGKKKVQKRGSSSDEASEEDEHLTMPAGSVVVGQELLVSWLEEAAYLGASRAIEEMQERQAGQEEGTAGEETPYEEERPSTEKDEPKPWSKEGRGSRETSWQRSGNPSAAGAAREVKVEQVEGDGRMSFSSGAGAKVRLHPRDQAPWRR